MSCSAFKVGIGLPVPGTWDVPRSRGLFASSDFRGAGMGVLGTGSTFAMLNMDTLSWEGD